MLVALVARYKVSQQGTVEPQLSEVERRIQKGQMKKEH
jgi:hypothetical protein